MSALRELQREFAIALSDDSSSIPRAILDAPGGIEARLAIYRNNFRANFAATLELEFPVVAQLCGAEFFRELARDFQDAHPSHGGDLHRIGGPFPHFLRQRFGTTEYAYFGDVAALEWAREEAQTAADAAPLAVDSLRELPADDIATWHATLHPSMHIVESPWPILTIWRAHQHGPEVPAVDLTAGAEHVLVWRGDTAMLALVDRAETAWLHALEGGAPFGDALDAALGVDAHFELARVLRRAVERGILTGLGPTQ